MVRRLYFPLVVLFWLAMNLLLWRSEMGAGKPSGSPVPLALVWQRVLTAPDDSSLQVVAQGRRLGFCRWAANVGEELATGKTASEDQTLDGRVSRLTGYTLDVEGNLLVGEGPQRVRFTWHADFGTNQVWRKLYLRVILRPMTWEIRADAGAEKLTLRVEESAGTWERELAFTDLQRPEKWWTLLGQPAGMAWLADWGLGLGKLDGSQLGMGLACEAHSDWLKVGHSPVRVYRASIRLLDKCQAVVFVSRIGEILRVELPSGWVLVNEALSNY